MTKGRVFYANNPTNYKTYNQETSLSLLITINHSFSTIWAGPTNLNPRKQTTRMESMHARKVYHLITIFKTFETNTTLP